MPIHDWTRVRPGVFHAFHQVWIAMLQVELNNGLLPPGYSALCEQVTGMGDPDLIALSAEPGLDSGNGHPPQRGVTVAAVNSPPNVQFVQDLEASIYARKASVLSIRHSSSGERVIAILEIVSSGNKSSQHALRAFVQKIATTLTAGIHVLLVDVHPPTPRDPDGIHATIWTDLGGDPPPETDKRLTMAAYTGMPTLRAYVEPFAVGDALKPMPLFLTVDDYVSVPLEETYTRAFQSMPAKTRAVLEAPAT